MQHPPTLERQGLHRRYVVVTDAENKALGYVRRRDLHRQTGTCGQYLREFNATAASVDQDRWQR